MWLNSVLLYFPIFLLLICTVKYVNSTNINKNGLRKHMFKHNENHYRNDNNEIQRILNDIQIILLEDIEKDKQISKVMNNNIRLYKSYPKNYKYNKFKSILNLTLSLVSMLKTRARYTVMEIVPIDIENTLDIKRMFEYIYDFKGEKRFNHHLPKRFTVKENSIDNELNRDHKNNYYVVLLKNIWPFNLMSLFKNFKQLTENNIPNIREKKKENRVILRGVCEECIKSHVKKCFKALKLIPKRSCQVYYCKSNFKKAFMDKSKTACLIEFQGHDGKSNKSRIRINKNKRTSDITRTGMQCYSGAYNLKKHKRKDSVYKLGSKAGFKFDALRDRYEKSCQKALSKKCIKACENVIKQTCESFVCKSDLKRSMKKNCKKNCKNVFIIDEDSNSDDSTSSSEESSDSE